MATSLKRTPRASTAARRTVESWVADAGSAEKTSPSDSHHDQTTERISPNSASCSNVCKSFTCRWRYDAVTMESPYPAKALLASFHSGRWHIQMPPPGTNVDILDNTGISNFSKKVTCNKSSPSCTNRPSDPNFCRRVSLDSCCSQSKRMDCRGSATNSW